MLHCTHCTVPVVLYPLYCAGTAASAACSSPELRCGSGPRRAAPPYCFYKSPRPMLAATEMSPSSHPEVPTGAMDRHRYRGQRVLTGEARVVSGPWSRGQRVLLPRTPFPLQRALVMGMAGRGLPVLRGWGRGPEPAMAAGTPLFPPAGRAMRATARGRAVRQGGGCRNRYRALPCRHCRCSSSPLFGGCTLPTRPSSWSSSSSRG